MGKKQHLMFSQAFLEAEACACMLAAQHTKRQTAQMGERHVDMESESRKLRTFICLRFVWVPFLPQNWLVWVICAIV